MNKITTVKNSQNDTPLSQACGAKLAGNKQRIGSVGVEIIIRVNDGRGGRRLTVAA